MSATCRRILRPPHLPNERIPMDILAAKQRLSLDDAHHRMDFDIGISLIGALTRSRTADHYADWFGTDTQKQSMGEKALCAAGPAAP